MLPIKPQDDILASHNSISKESAQASSDMCFWSSLLHISIEPKGIIYWLMHSSLFLLLFFNLKPNTSKASSISGLKGRITLCGWPWRQWCGVVLPIVQQHPGLPSRNLAPCEVSTLALSWFYIKSSQLSLQHQPGLKFHTQVQLPNHATKSVHGLSLKSVHLLTMVTTAWLSLA